MLLLADVSINDLKSESYYWNVTAGQKCYKYGWEKALPIIAISVNNRRTKVSGHIWSYLILVNCGKYPNCKHLM